MAFFSQRKAVLVTGACGEIGSELLRELLSRKVSPLSLVCLDLATPQEKCRVPGVDYLQGDVSDSAVFQHLEQQYDFEEIFHLAGVLPSSGENNPEWALRVNEVGMMNVLQFAKRNGERKERATKVIFPSSLATFGIPMGGESDSRESFRERLGALAEDQHLEPITIYGVSKLSAENLGRYYSRHYQLLAKEEIPSAVDFRCLRLPTVLSIGARLRGGSTDYVPEMIHSAAQGRMYECFVRPKTRIPFLALPDAVRALLELSSAPKANLSRCVYNVAGLSLSAEEIAAEVRRNFPNSAIVFKPDRKRMKILESWPVQMNDEAAREDWGWKRNFGVRECFEKYLVPAAKLHYGPTEGSNVVDGLRAVV